MGDVLELQQPLTEGGIRSINFFNGRLLTSKDLSREQDGRREADRRLGKAIGDGVAFGLEVEEASGKSTAAEPVVMVKAGLAVNRKGQTLSVQADTLVALTRRLESGSSLCLFANCQPIAGGSYVAGAGVYMLTIAPAEQSEGKAQTNGLDPQNVRCNTDATVEAVQFRLLSIPPTKYAALNPGATQFRNQLAYLCFGIDERTAADADPVRADRDTYGLIDSLRDDRLTDFEVPLALLFWTVGGLRFVDLWSVRRPVIASDGEREWAFIARQRRLIEGLCMVWQFQQQLDDMIGLPQNLDVVIGVDYFRYLPPFGVVPLKQAPLRGFQESAFFSSLVRRPVSGSTQPTEFIDARLLGALFRDALAYPPTDLQQQEFLWVYRPWQVMRKLVEGGSAQPIVVFATGQLPEPSVSRFDMARWDYSNYAACCGAK